MDQQSPIGLFQSHARFFELLGCLLLGLVQQLVEVGPFGPHQLSVYFHVHYGTETHFHHILGQDGAGDAAQDQRQGPDAQQDDQYDGHDPTGLADPVDLGLNVAFHFCVPPFIFVKSLTFIVNFWRQYTTVLCVCQLLFYDKHKIIYEDTDLPAVSVRIPTNRQGADNRQREKRNSKSPDHRAFWDTCIVRG